jgi:rhodanese-related sulfurtransferase
LAEAGYTVVNLDGGILAWQAAGKKIVHKRVPEIK